jgi:hypothetical protein
MQKSASQSLAIPISLVILAIVAALVITVFSLGLFWQLGAVLVGLSFVLFGVWLLLNRRSTASKIASSILIFIPVLAVACAFLRMVTGHA